MHTHHDLQNLNYSFYGTIFFIRLVASPMQFIMCVPCKTKPGNAISLKIHIILTPARPELQLLRNHFYQTCSFTDTVYVTCVLYKTKTSKAIWSLSLKIHIIPTPARAKWQLLWNKFFDKNLVVSTMSVYECVSSKKKKKAMLCQNLRGLNPMKTQRYACNLNLSTCIKMHTTPTPSKTIITVSAEYHFSNL